MNTFALALMFFNASQTFNLPPKLLESICFVETKHDVKAIHEGDGDSDSLGICQVKLATAQWLGFKGSEHDLMRPEVNIYFAAKYLAYQQRRYKNISRAIVAYNRGNATNLTTSTYSDKVLKQWETATNDKRAERRTASAN